MRHLADSRKAARRAGLRSAVLAVGLVGITGAFARADLTFQRAGDALVNVPWPTNANGGAPNIDTMDVIANDTVSDAPGNYTNVVGEQFLVTAQTFTPTSSFKLGQIAIVGNGGANANLSAHLFDLTAGTAGTSSLPGSYNLSTANTGNTPTPDLLGGGSGLDFGFNGSGTNGFLEFQFSGNDQVNLQAGHQYAFEIWRPTNADGTLFWYRVGGASTLPPSPTTYGNPYPGGDGYDASTGSDPTVLRTQLAGQDRDLMMAVYDTSALPGFPMQVDLNGGNSGELRPNEAGWRPWGGVGNSLPTAGDNNNGNVPEGGYPNVSSITRQFGTSGLISGTMTATIRSVDVGGTNAPTYLNDGAKLNSADLSITGRELDNSGNFTPTKDYVYRDFVSAEAGSSTVTNGTNHRMEVNFQGLDAKTTYKITLYSYDNSNQKQVSVFTDVTAQPLIFLPSAESSDGNFTPGDGSGGTQYAPAGQYIDGTAPVVFPTTDNFRAIDLYVTSDANGNITLAGTTVAGLSGQSQVLPILNGFELVKAESDWSGTNGNWNDSANWVGGTVANGKGQSATFASSSASNVNVDAPTTVGRISFTGSGATTIGGSATLTLDDTSINSTLSFNVTGRTRIDLAAGSGHQTISAPLQMNKDTEIDTATAGETLTMNNLQPAAVTLTKSDAGTLEVNNVRTNGLRVNGGTVRMLADGTAAGVSVVGGLSVAGGAKLDVTNNKLIVTAAGATGTWDNTAQAYNGVTGMVASARHGGAWDGSGITSSMASTGGSNLFTLGVAKAGDIKQINDSDTAAFAGQTVHGSDTIVMYTYGGDANLDGKINIDDYGRIDGNVGQSGSVFGWYNGDFNYDGKINIDDYGIIDGNIGLQGAPIPTAGIGGAVAGVAAVPEPASLGMLAIAGAGLLRRRRRN